MFQTGVFQPSLLHSKYDFEKRNPNMIIEQAAAAGHLSDVSATQMWTAVAIFIATYGVVLTERINRAIVAVLGAGLMVLLGVMTQEQAVHSVDANTIGLLLGMMILVAVMKESGVFQYVAIKSAKVVKAEPIKMLVVFAIVTAVFSALLDNVTTVLLTTPVILLITRELNVKPYPYLFTSILASNIGGAATLIGDPPNIMIGSAAHLGFSDFIINVAPASVVIMIATLIPLMLLWRKSLHAEDHAKERIMRMNEKEAIQDKELLIKSLVVMGMVLIGFVVGHSYHIMPATVALTGAALLLLLDNVHHNSEKQHDKVHHAIGEAEWVTLFFFGGLFVLVHGIQNVGVISWLADHMMAMTNGDRTTTIFTILWGSAILSALVDNIPFVATMIPIIQEMAPSMGGEEAIKPLWWALSLGACLGGNGSLIGASANLVVAGFAEKAGHRIPFLTFMLMAFPLMLMSIAIASVYVWFVFI